MTSVEKNKYLNFIFKTGLENFFSRVKFGGSEISSRLNLLHADALEIVKNASSTSFDVIFLDPMYPEKKSQALASGEMQLFQELLNDEICESATEELIDTAISSGCKRVVLKRPLKAPVIGKVSYSQKGSKTRYDIYLPRS